MTMKVFVYSKKTNVRLAVIVGIVSVNLSAEHVITFTSNSGESFSFNTREVKTTSYQN